MRQDTSEVIQQGDKSGQPTRQILTRLTNQTKHKISGVKAMNTFQQEPIWKLLA